MGKKFKSVLILMVLFTFAALLSEPPAEKAVPVESTPVQTTEKQLASPAEQDNEPVATEPEPAPQKKTIADADPVENKKPEASSDVKSMSEPDPVTEQPATTIDSSNYGESLQAELNKAVLTDVSVVYNEYYKTMVVELREDNPLSANFLRKTFALDTLRIMELAATHPDTVDEVTITGWTTMMRSDGNEETSKVYSAKAVMSNVQTVNWENLGDYAPDKIEAIENNMDSVWWHPGILK